MSNLPGASTGYLEQLPLGGMQPSKLQSNDGQTVRSALGGKSGRSFVLHVHRLRAIAILFIVTVHCVGYFTWTQHRVLSAFLAEFSQDSSVLFMFVAGFLFQHLAKSFRYDTYLMRKAKNVLIPYLVVATPAIAYALHVQSLAWDHPELQSTSLPYRIGWFYLNGGATFNVALWFIPVLTIFYLAAPLFMLLQKRPYLYHILWLLIPLSLLAHRPTYTGGHNLQFAVYFLSPYILGMCCSQGGDKALEFINGKLPWLIAAYLMILFVRTFGSSHHGMDQVQEIFTFQSGYIDWLFLQKLILTVLLLGILPRFNRVTLPLLDYVADVSFTIYFVHMYVLFVLVRTMHYQKFEGNLLYLSLLIVGVVAASSLVAYLARHFMGRHSRILVGS